MGFQENESNIKHWKKFSMNSLTEYIAFEKKSKNSAI